MHIDELFKMYEYDIYHNANVQEDKIEEIAGIIAKDKEIDLIKYFDLKICSDKFCWNNFISVIEKLPYEDKFRGISILFELLQDANWPVYQHVICVLEQFDKDDLSPYCKKYLEQAYAEIDDMWIENLQFLEEKVKQQRRQNK